MKEIARGYPNVVVIRGSEESTGLPEECCDVILMRLVYHAVDKPDFIRRSLLKALRPGGRLLVIGFRPPLEELERAMRATGFTVVERIPAGDWPADDVYALLLERPE